MNKLGSVHLGNGLSIYRKGEDDHIAHISPDRRISIRNKGCTIEGVEQIIELAKKDDRNISVTQKQKVFNERPKTY